MTTQPLISIITASFNSQKTIAATIESVLFQTYSNIEYLIIDGGSTDATVEIINSYINKFSGRLKLVSEKDKGMYDAMNKGISRSAGELIGILNSDDWYELNAVETMVSKYLTNSTSVLYGILRYVENGREVMLHRMNHNFLEKDMITHPTCFIPRKIYEHHGMFDLTYRISADYELMLRFKKRGVSFIPLDSIIANFAVGGVSTSGIEGIVESFRIKYKYGIISHGQLIWNIFKIRAKSLLEKKSTADHPPRAN